MKIKDQVESDLKQAMLAGDKQLVSILRNIKSVILNAEVAKVKRDTGLPDSEVEALLAKEVKLRRETADIYKNAGDDNRAKTEMLEKEVIERYLPPQMDNEELSATIDRVIKDAGSVSMQDMGSIIGQVKQIVGSSADGDQIAKLAKEKLQ